MGSSIFGYSEPTQEEREETDRGQYQAGADVLAAGVLGVCSIDGWEFKTSTRANELERNKHVIRRGNFSESNLYPRSQILCPLNRLG